MADHPESAVEAVAKAIRADTEDYAKLHDGLIWAQECLRTHVKWLRHIKNGHATEAELHIAGNETKQQECIERYDSLCLALRHVLDDDPETKARAAIDAYTGAAHLDLLVDALSRTRAAIEYARSQELAGRHDWLDDQPILDSLQIAENELRRWLPTEEKTT